MASQGWTIRLALHVENFLTLTLSEQPEEPGEKQRQRFRLAVAKKRKDMWTTDIEKFITIEDALTAFNGIAAPWLEGRGFRQ